ncbi:MAG: hypothetical protein A2622_00215 [Bdellovibrionales bacterium RIFCSPHIGHO2_01_FULL_40_29]|nr:MAG: hypothetical protein A2622_00215 [Bdellovibrionales bacterium RIFCSPHIGHO2_01_FULL_40_29]OFZ32550.1 MAG: hypothetical protein A3D17_04815 [Bdellovibrionales bacterium RIFCSPHIGHO2_02_FULL_40_15]
MKLFGLILTLITTASVVHARPAGLEISSTKPQIEQRINHSFGRIFVNTTAYVRYDITNTGDVLIPFEGAYVYGANFTARHNCGDGIAAKARCHVDIRYWPMTEGHHTGEVDMLFGENNDIQFFLWGEATR